MTFIINTDNGDKPTIWFQRTEQKTLRNNNLGNSTMLFLLTTPSFVGSQNFCLFTKTIYLYIWLYSIKNCNYTPDIFTGRFKEKPRYEVNISGCILSRITTTPDIFTGRFKEKPRYKVNISGCILSRITTTPD